VAYFTVLSCHLPIDNDEKTLINSSQSTSPVDWPRF